MYKDMRLMNQEFFHDGEYQITIQPKKVMLIVRDGQQVFSLSKSHFSLQASNENDLLVVKKYTDNKYLSSLISVLLKKKTTWVSIALPYKSEILKYVTSILSALNPLRGVTVEDIMSKQVQIKPYPPGVEIAQFLPITQPYRKVLPILRALDSVSEMVNHSTGWLLKTNNAGYYFSEDEKLYILWKEENYDMSEFEKIKKYLGENQTLFEWAVKNIKVFRIMNEDHIPSLLKILSVLKTYKKPPTELYKMDSYFLMNKVLVYGTNISEIDISGLFDLSQNKFIRVYFVGKNELMLEIQELNSYKEASELIQEIKARLDQIKIRNKPILLPKKHLNYLNHYNNTEDYMSVVVKKTVMKKTRYTALILKAYRLPYLISRLNAIDKGLFRPPPET